MNITIYTNGVSIVKEMIDVHIFNSSEYILEDIPSTMDERSFSCSFSNDNIKVINSEIIKKPTSTEDVYKRSIGKRIKYSLDKNNSYEGILKSINPIAIENNNEIMVLPDDGVISIKDYNSIFSDIIKIKIESNVNGTFPCEVSYRLKDGIKFEVLYDCIVNFEKNFLSFDGKIIITNNSGVNISDAEISVVKNDSEGNHVVYPLYGKFSIDNNSSININILSISERNFYTEYIIPLDKNTVNEVACFKNNADIDFPSGICSIYTSLPYNNNMLHVNTIDIDHSYPQEDIKILLYENSSNVIAEKNTTTEDDLILVETVIKNMLDNNVSVIVEESISLSQDIISPNAKFTIDDYTGFAYAVIDLHPHESYTLSYQIKDRPS